MRVRVLLAAAGLAAFSAGGAILLVLEPPIVIGLTLAATGTALAARRPLYGLVLILGLIALLGSDSLFHLQAGIEWVEVDLLLGVAVLGMLAGLLMRRSAIRLGGIDFLIAFFVLLVGVGAYHGLVEGYTLDEVRPELRPAGYLVGMYAIARATIRKEGQAAVVFAAFVAFTILSALKVLAVYLLVPPADPGSAERVIWATRVMNSDGFKRVIAQGAEVFPILAGLMMISTVGSARSLSVRLAGWLGVSLLMVVILLSLTRSYWLGLGAGLACLAVTGRLRPVGRIAVELALVGAVAYCLVRLAHQELPGLAVFETAEHARSRLLDTASLVPDASGTARLGELESIQEIVSASPWFGTGLGGSYSFYSDLEGGLREWEYTHNSYSFWAMKLGIPGLVATLSLLAAGLASATSWMRRSSDRLGRAVGRGVLAGMVALGVVSMTAPWLSHYVGTAWFGLALGSCESVRLGSRPDAAGESRS